MYYIQYAIYPIVYIQYTIGLQIMYLVSYIPYYMYYKPDLDPPVCCGLLAPYGRASMSAVSGGTAATAEQGLGRLRGVRGGTGVDNRAV